MSRSIIILVLALFFASHANAFDRADALMGIGIALGSSASSKPGKQVAGAIVGGYIGYEVGEAMEARRAARERVAMAQGTTTCSTSSSGRIVGGQLVVQEAGFNCQGQQTLPGVYTTPQGVR